MTSFEAKIRKSRNSGLYYVSIYQDDTLIAADVWYGFSFAFARLAAKRHLRRHRKNKWVVR